MILEQPETIALSDLTLEAALAMPPGARAGVVVCHPHPLYGGDMDNPVVTGVARACTEAGLATLRFNFRGVGGSGGAWDDGRGEQDDVRAALAHLRRLLPAGAPVALAGYSFGAAMSAAVAGAGEALGGLALIAPPLAMRPWQPPASLAVAGPILLAAGSADEYCPAAALTALGRALPKATITVLDGVDHFFFGGLDRLAKAAGAWAAAMS
jgi:alpha/beta superfamily hydrolase